MILSKPVRILLTLSFLLTSLPAGACFSMPENLSPPLFTEALTAADTNSNTAAAFLKYIATALSRQNRRIDSLSAAELNQFAMTCSRTRFEIIELSLAEGTVTIILTLNDKRFKAVSSDNGETFNAEELPNNDAPRAFPAMPEASGITLDDATTELLTPIMIPPEILTLCVSINASPGEYRLTNETFADRVKIAQAIASVIAQAAKKEPGIFRDIPHSSDLLEISGELNFDMIPVNYWLNNHTRLKAASSMLVRVAQKYPELKEGIFTLCKAEGLCSYLRRGPLFYSAAEAFYGTCHELFPDDFNSHNSWMWALYHTGDLVRAKSELAKLKAKDQENNPKLIIEDAQIRLNETIKELKALEAGASVIEQDEFSERLISVRAALERIIGLVSSLPSYPRALSLRGQAYYFRARLFLLEAQTSRLRGWAGPKDRSMIVFTETLNSAGESARLLGAAVIRANGSNGAADHAKIIYGDMIANVAKLYVDALILARNERLFIADKENFINLCFDKISSAIDSNTIKVQEASVTLNACGDDLRALVTAQNKAKAAAVGILMKECSENDLKNPAGLMRKVRSGVIASLQASAGPGSDVYSSREAASCVTRYIRKQIIRDRLGLGITIALSFFGKDSSEKLTVSAVKEACEMISVTEGIQEDRVNALAKALLNRQLETPASPDDNLGKDFNKPGNGIAQLLDKATFKASLEAGNGASFPNRLAALKNISERLITWERSGFTHANYVSPLTSMIATIKCEIEIYAPRAEAYLSAQPPDAARRRTLRSEGEDLSSFYAQIRHRFTCAEKFAAKRSDFIVAGIKEKNAAWERELSDTAAEFEKLDHPLLSDIISTAREAVEQALSIADEHSEYYLSWGTYEASASAATDLLSNLRLIKTRLNQNINYMAGIPEILEELDLLEADLDCRGEFEEMRRVLTKARETIIVYCAGRISLEEVSEMPEVKAIWGVGTRLLLIKAFRRIRVQWPDMDVVESIPRIFWPSRDSSSLEELAAKTDRAVADKIKLAMIRTKPSAIADIFDLSRPIPEEAAITAQMDATFPVLNIIRNPYLVRECWPFYIKALNILVSAAYLDFSVDDVQKAEELRDRLSACLEIALSPGDLNKSERFGELEKLVQGDISSQLKDISDRFLCAVQKQKLLMILITETYLSEWPHKSIKPEERATRTALIAKLKEYLQSVDSDDRARRVSLIEAVSKLKESLNRDPCGGDGEAINTVANINHDNALLKYFFVLDNRSRYTPLVQSLFGNDVSCENSLLYVLPIYSRDNGEFLGVTAYLADFARRDVKKASFMADPDNAFYKEHPEAAELATWLSKTALKYNAALTSHEGDLRGHRLHPFFTDRVSDVWIKTQDLIHKSDMDPFDGTQGAITGIEGVGSIYLMDIFARVTRDLTSEGVNDLRASIMSISPHENQRIATLRQRFNVDSDPSPEAMKFRHRVDILSAVNSNQWLFFCSDGLSEHTYAALAAISNSAAGKELYRPQMTADELRSRADEKFGSTPRPCLNGENIYLKGVYYDGREKTFATPASGSGIWAENLKNALDMALQMYIQGVSESDPLHSILSALDVRNARVKIEVKPTNGIMSLTSGNTIVFDSKFISFFFETYDEHPKAALALLGERLVHELGHSAFLSRSDSGLDRLVSEESEQMFRDVVIYKRVVLSDPRLMSDLEILTDMPSTPYPGLYQKFSKAFGTKQLFLNYQKWAAMLDKGLIDDVRTEIRSYAEVSVKASGTLFSANASSAAARSTLMQGVAIVNTGANKYIEVDMEVLVRHNRHFMEVLENMPEPQARATVTRALEASYGLAVRFTGEDPAPRHFPAGALQNATGGTLDAIKRAADLNVSMLNDIAALPAEHFASKRRILISSELIPKCQKVLIDELNRLSREAFDEGRTRDLIEIQPFGYIHNARNDRDFDTVVILEKSEKERYNGRDKCLVFEASGDGTKPININGLVTAGRAVLYKRIDILLEMLSSLSGISMDQLPSTDDILAAMVKGDRFMGLNALPLPPARCITSVIPAINNSIVMFLKFA